MTWILERLSKSKLKMTAWLITLFMVGAFVCLWFHKQIGLDVTILGMLAGGLVGIPAALLGTRGSNTEVTTPPSTPMGITEIPPSICPHCGKTV